MKSPSFAAKACAICILCLALLLAGPAYSSWRVIPIRLDLDQRTRSGVITITNDSEKKITFSVQAREWTQDEEGRDVYSETSDILFFPKVLTLAPNSERIIRAGIKVPALDREKTYRLFIKQETSPRKDEDTAVAIAIRFGLPIFSKPLKEEVDGEILKASFREGALDIDIRNRGNTHFRVNTLRVTGKDASGEAVLSKELNGGYLLAGSERTFTAAVPEDLCSRLAALDIEVISERIHLDRGFDVEKGMCPAP